MMRKQICPTKCIYTLITSLLMAAPISASTVAHYHFEDGAYLSDASGNGNDLTAPASGGPSQVAIPGTGAGSAFSQFPGNGYFSDGSSATDALNGPDLSVVSGGTNGDFTLELLANKQNQTTTTQYMVSEYVLSTAARGYAFGVGGSVAAGGGAIDPNELFVIVSDFGNTGYIFGSGITITTGDDYYLAISFDLSDQAGGVTFYAQNLTAGSALQIESLAHTLSAVKETTSPLTIGAYAGDNNLFQGYIDEVRISDVELSQGDLLISAIPEPAATTLISGILVCLLVAKRRFVRQ